MKTIVIASTKGGVGKTSLCCGLAVQCLNDKGKVALIDFDPQRSLAEWADIRQRTGIRDLLFNDDIDLPLQDRMATLEEQGASHLFIDTPPAFLELLDKVVEQADLVIIPSRTSIHDLRAIDAITAISNDLGIPFMFVLMQVVAKAKVNGQARQFLANEGTVANTMITYRQTYSQSTYTGKAAQEVAPSDTSAKEIANLWKEVKTELKTGEGK